MSHHEGLQVDDHNDGPVVDDHVEAIFHDDCHEHDDYRPVADDHVDAIDHDHDHACAVGWRTAGPGWLFPADAGGVVVEPAQR
jgi:hypothetical protein